VTDYPYRAKDRLQALISSLKTLLARDPDQEVDNIAIPDIEATFALVKAARPDIDTPQLFTADYIGSGDTFRAAALLIIAERIGAELGPYPRRIPGVA
jgi:hypothetical protein